MIVPDDLHTPPLLGLSSFQSNPPISTQEQLNHGILTDSATVIKRGVLIDLLLLSSFSSTDYTRGLGPALMDTSMPTSMEGTAAARITSPARALLAIIAMSSTERMPTAWRELGQSSREGRRKHEPYRRSGGVQ